MSVFGSARVFVVAAAIGGTALVGVAAPAGASDEFSWSGAVDVSTQSPQNDGSIPQVAVSADGSKATAIWVGGSSVQSASATITGNVAVWGAVATLSTGTVTFSTSPKVALSADGTKATAVWNEETSGTNPVQVLSATIAGNVQTWNSTPTTLSTGATYSAYLPQVSMSSDGSTAIATWQRYNGNNYVVPASVGTITGNAGSWTSAADVSTSASENSGSHVRMSSDGSKATVLWQSQSGGYKVVSRSATISSGSPSWGSVASVTTSGASSESQLTMSSDGTRVTAVWTLSSPNKIQSASGTVTGNSIVWAGISDVTTSGSASSPQVAGASTDGSKVTVVWYVGSSGFPGYPVRSASATVASDDTQSWGSTTDLSSCTYNAQLAQVASSADGSTVRAVWICQGSNVAKKVIQTKSASVSGNAATWDGSAVSLSDPAQNATNPQIAMSTTGSKATAVWARSNGTNNIIQSASGASAEVAPMITSGGSASATASSPMTPFSVTTTGTPTVTGISQAAVGQQTGLPPGVSLTHSSGSSATISGTPTTSGTFTTTLTASNGVNPAATQVFTLTVAAAGAANPQVLSNPNCVNSAVPNGRRVTALTIGKCVTSAGQPVGTKTAIKAPRGDMRSPMLRCKTGRKLTAVTKLPAYGRGYSYCPRGSLVLIGNGQRARATVTWFAPATGDFAAYKKVKKIRIR